MVKHNQTIPGPTTNYLNVFDHFVWLALKGLRFLAYNLRTEILNRLSLKYSTKVHLGLWILLERKRSPSSF